MPFEVGEAINSLANKLTSAPIIRKISQNPMYTALLMTLVIVLIVMFIFRDAETDGTLLALCLRSGFYIFVFLVGGIFLHDRVLMDDTAASVQNSDVAAVFAPTQTTGMEDIVVPVNVNFTGVGV